MPQWNSLTSLSVLAVHCMDANFNFDHTMSNLQKKLIQPGNWSVESAYFSIKFMVEKSSDTELNWVQLCLYCRRSP